MECKNCQTEIIDNKKYCFNCGAKVIVKRLTIKSATEEFFSSFISWDNKFYKTFIHLFKEPSNVINGYINGVRKKYMQPFAFLLVALTIYGIYLYFAKDYLNNMISELLAQQQNTPNLTEDKKNILTRFNDIYYGILINKPNVFYFILIPFSALINRLLFKKNKFNFIEHNVLFAYAFAVLCMVSSIIGFLSLFVFKNIIISSIIIYSFWIFYFGYVFKEFYKIYKLKLVLKTVLYFMAIIVIFLILTSILFGFVVYTMKK